MTHESARYLPLHADSTWFAMLLNTLAYCWSLDSFIWDTVDSIFNASTGFVVHAIACLAVFGFSFVSLSSLEP